MLTIGEFSKICKVSTKTLRYYETIDLLNPICIKAESGYRYYAIEQLKNMLFINRMKTYGFSLDEIRTLLKWEEQGESKLLQNALLSHRKILQEQILWMQQTLHELEADVATVQKEEMIMSYLDDIDIQLVEEPEMFLLSTRRMVNMEDCAKGFISFYEPLFEKIRKGRLTICKAPLSMYHSKEYQDEGFDMEFAIPVKERVTGTRDFSPGLCIRTVCRGSYHQIPSVYARHQEWMETEGYTYRLPPYDVYITHPDEVADMEENITEIYSPIMKR